MEPRYVFIEDKKEVYKAVRVLSTNRAELVVQDLQDSSRTLTVNEDQTFPISSLEELDHPPNDLILLSAVNRPAILHTLRSRFLVDQIYTNVGAILVAVNPFKRITGMYDTEVMREFSSSVTDVPHIFGVARDSYDGLKRGKNQSLVISGESGAGKTEATKQALSYLAFVAGSNSGVQEKILLSSPVLEAWGNAKTLRNNNSSRFGKFIEVWFGKFTDIIGSSTTTYLLEKSRVVFQERDERNYHVFYQLLFGAPIELLQELRLDQLRLNPENIALINQSGCIQMDTIDDAADYQEVAHAFASLGFTPVESKTLSRVIAGIIHMGNVRISAPSDGDACFIAPESQESLDAAVDMWGVPVHFMQQSLLQRSVKSGGRRTSVVLTPHTHVGAIDNKNSLTKEIYNRCFDWIVLKINESMMSKTVNIGSIGVLDIFGFEIFKKNSLEQLCINLANEALQQHFNFNIFQAEMDFYRSEDISVVDLVFSDNQDVLDFIMKRPGGLIALLDEEGVVPKGSVDGFLGKLTKAHSSNRRFVNKPRTKEFGVNHYAGEVTYDPTLFLSKNKDSLSQDIIDVMKLSSIPFIADLFKESAASEGDTSKAGAANTNKQTVGRKFTIQLEALMATLNKTHPHYVRCIKPNQVKKPNVFESSISNEQLTYSGIFEAVLIMQNGYPYRLSLKDFISRYHMLVLDNTIRKTEIFNNSPDSSRAASSSAKPKDKLRQQNAALVNHAARIHQREELLGCHVGKTVVLYRSPQHKAFESLRYAALLLHSKTIQRFFRGAIVRKVIKNLKTYSRLCKEAISSLNSSEMKVNAKRLKLELLRIAKVTNSNNFIDFPVQSIAESFAVALDTEKINEEKLKSLLSNTSVSHVVANIDRMVAANDEIKSVSFSAVLDGVEIKRIWSENRQFIEVDTKIRRLRSSVDLRSQLKAAIADKDDIKLEMIIETLGTLRSHHEIIGGYCSDDEQKGLKIAHDARVAFSEFMNQTVVSLTNGGLTISRDPQNNALTVQVSSVAVSELLRGLSQRKSRNSTIRIALMIDVCNFIRDLRAAAETGDWTAVASLLDSCIVGSWTEGLHNATNSATVPSSSRAVRNVYIPTEIENQINLEISLYRICVVQFLDVPIVDNTLKSSPAFQSAFSLDVPMSYITSLKDANVLLQPHVQYLNPDTFLKSFAQVVEVKEVLWTALYEGRVSVIKNSMESLNRVAPNDPDFIYAGRLLQMHTIRDSIYRSIENDGPRGEPGSVDFSCINTTPLDLALSEAKLLTVSHSLWSLMIESVTALFTLRQLLYAENLTEALSFASSPTRLTHLLNASYAEDLKRSTGDTAGLTDSHSSSSLLIDAAVLAAEEIQNAKLELLHVFAFDSFCSAIINGAVRGEVGNIKLTLTDPYGMTETLDQVRANLIVTQSTQDLIDHVNVVGALRRAVLAQDWSKIENVIDPFFQTTNGFADCHKVIKMELTLIYAEVQDLKLRNKLMICLERCQGSKSESGEYEYDVQQIALLKQSIEEIELRASKSYETTYMLATANILYGIAIAVNNHFWEPSALFCSKLSGTALNEYFSADDESDEFRQRVDVINQALNFEALEGINSYSSPITRLNPANCLKYCVSELLVHASYIGIHSLAAAEITRIREIAYDRRCRACLLLSAVKGRVGGSIHSGLDTSTIDIASIIRALKYINLYQKYWSPTVANWANISQELLNVRLAVLSSTDTNSKKDSKINLGTYLQTEELNSLIENTTFGFPLREIKFVVDHVNDILLMKSISEALMQGRPQYIMGTFSTQHVQYDNLLGLLIKSKRLRQRSDRLDRLMFYSDLCVMVRRALLSHHWDTTAAPVENEEKKTQSKSSDRNPGVKQCVEEYRLANKFFSMNKMDGVPPKCLHDEFESIEREFERRAILQEFSVVMQSGAITGAPFALHIRAVNVKSLEAQVRRVRAWEEQTGVFDIGIQTLTKACAEILSIRTQVKQVQALYERKTVITVNSNDVRDILSTAYVTDCIELALHNTSKLYTSPYPMLTEWEPVERIVSTLEVASMLRSSKKEIDLVTAETFSRNFIAKVMNIFLNIGTKRLSFERANQAIIDLYTACQAYSIRVQEVDHKSKKSYYSSPVLEMMHQSAIIFIHLLRAEMLNLFDPPHRDWKIDSSGDSTPRISVLEENLASGQYSLQALIRTCYPLTLHPRLVVYIKHLINDVEDRVSELELLQHLQGNSRQYGEVGAMDYDSISTQEFEASIQRIESIGIHRSELNDLHACSVQVCNLRIAIKNRNYQQAFELVDDFINESRRDFAKLLNILNKGLFSVHMHARNEFIQLAFEACDGYWRVLAVSSLVKGCVVGSRGLLIVSEIGWADIDAVLALFKLHLGLSPSSLQLQDLCFKLRCLRSQVLGSLEDLEGKRRQLSADVSCVLEPLIQRQQHGFKLIVPFVDTEFIDNVINRAILNVQSVSNTNNVSARSINFPLAAESVSALRKELAACDVLESSDRNCILQELDLIEAQIIFLRAKSMLIAAADMQSIWFTEFGLETREQFKSTIVVAVETALQQNWDAGVLQERWCRALLDTVLSVQVLHDQIQFTGMTSIQPGTSEFNSILPFINGVLSNIRDMEKIDSIPMDGVLFKSRIPKNLFNLSVHLNLAISENTNIARLQSILQSDKLSCSTNYAGRHIICVSHVSPVSGLNFYDSEYGPYALKLSHLIDKIKVTSFKAKQLQRISKMFVKMRMTVKMSQFNEALALCWAIKNLDDKSLTAGVNDCFEVQRYCEYLLCRRSLEYGISCCILPPFAGWSEFGAMPIFGLSIADAPLFEAIDKTNKVVPGFAKLYPELSALVDLGLLFLKLVAAVRTKSWTSLSNAAKSGSEDQDTQPKVEQPVGRVKGRRQSMMASGMQNLQPQFVSPENITSISIIESLSVAAKGLTPLKASMLCHCGETVQSTVAMIKSFLRGNKLIDQDIKSFILQIASQAETELKYAELEEASAKVFKECAIKGSPGNLIIPRDVIPMLSDLCERLNAEKILVNSCYTLRRAHQTASTMLLIHHALSTKSLGDLGKYLCLVSYMGSRKRIVQEGKCDDFLYRESLDDIALLGMQEFNFKSSIKYLARRLRHASGGNEYDASSDEFGATNVMSDSDQFIDEMSQEYLDCSIKNILRLREEFFDDLSLLEQHFTLECHFAEYIDALENRPAEGSPGELIVSNMQFETLSTIAHSLHHLGLVSSTCPAGVHLHRAVESLYLLRRAQKVGDLELLRTSLSRIDEALKAEMEFSGSFEDSADGKIKRRALELGIVDNSSDHSMKREFISAAAIEISLARQDLGQRELIVALYSGIREAVLAPSIVSSIYAVSARRLLTEVELPVSQLAHAVKLGNEISPACRKAISLHRTADALLNIRLSVNARRWVALKRFADSLDISLIDKCARDEINIALRIATVANAIEKSIRAYKIGSIYGHPGKIEDHSSIDCSVVEEALAAFADIEEEWKTRDIMTHYFSCVVLTSIRKHFINSEWFVVCDMATLALEPRRLFCKPLAGLAEAEIRLALEHSSYMISYEALSKACREGRLKGDVGHIDTSDVSIIVVDRALAISQTLNCRMNDIAVMETSVAILRDMRLAQLLGHWIPITHRDTLDCVSVERAVTATSYGIPATDVFGYSYEQSKAHMNSKYLSIADGSEISTIVDRGDSSHSIHSRSIVKATQLDPDLSDLFITQGRVTLGEEEVSLDHVKSVKEVIAHAREVQNTMDLSVLILDELELAANEVTYREVSFGLLRAIRTSGIQGVPGAIDTSKVRTHELLEAIAVAEGSGELSRKSNCRWLLRDAKILLAIRQKTVQHNWKLLSIIVRDAERQNSPDYVDPVDKVSGLPIILPVWTEVSLVISHMAFQMCLAQFAQEMQNLHEFSTVGTKNSSRVVAMLRVLILTMRTSHLHPCIEFEHLIEAEAAALELRVFHNFEPDKNPSDIIHRVGEAKRRDLTSGNVSYMTLLMSDISNMSNVVDKQLHVDLLQNEIINGQLYLMRPLGRIDTSVLDVDRLNSALESAMPLVSVMGSPSEIKLLRLCEAVVALRYAVKSGNWLEVRSVVEDPSNADPLKSSLVHDEVDRLKCEIENYEACSLLESTIYMGRFMNVVNLARLVCKPRGSLVDRAMSAGEKRRMSQLPSSFFGGLESLERAMLAGNIVRRRSEILNGYLRAASLIYRIRDKMAHGQWEELKSLLQDESKYSSLPQFAVEELRAIKAGMAYRNTMSTVCNALINGCVTGVPGNVILSTVDAYSLQQALNEAAILEMSDVATAIMFDVGTCICKLRNAVKEGRWFPVKSGASHSGEVSPTATRTTSTLFGAVKTDSGVATKSTSSVASLMFSSISNTDLDDSTLSDGEWGDEVKKEVQSPVATKTTLAVAGFKPFSSQATSHTQSGSTSVPVVQQHSRLRSRSTDRNDPEGSFAIYKSNLAASSSVQEIVEDFLAKKDMNFSQLREALSIDESEDKWDDDGDADWMLQQWEALLQVQKEVDLVSSELKERKVSSSIVFALENIPEMVQNFGNVLNRPSKTPSGREGTRLSFRGASSNENAADSTGSGNEEDDQDPLKIQLLERCLDECTIPSLSSHADEVSKETEKLITTAKLILRFRVSLLNFDLNEFKVLLDEAKVQQNLGLLSSHYGVHELSVYRSSSMAITIARSKLLLHMRSGRVSGRLDAVAVDKIDTASLCYWINTCSVLSQSARDIIGDLTDYISEAAHLVKLRDAMKAGEMEAVRLLLKDPAAQGKIAAIEVAHVRMICKYQDSSQELAALLSGVSAVMDSTLVIKIPPLEDCLRRVDEVLHYESELLPSSASGQVSALSSDIELRKNHRVGYSVLNLWKAIRSNNWNTESIAASNVHDLETPKDYLLLRLFDSIKQHEATRKLDSIHTQLQMLGLDKTASTLPHRNIRSSIHIASFNMGYKQSLTGVSSKDSFLTSSAVTALLQSDDSGIPLPKFEPPAPKKTRRVSVVTTEADSTFAQSEVRKKPSSFIRSDAAKGSRRRSISEVAPFIKLHHSNSIAVDPQKSASALLCKEDWSEFPTNIKRLFNSARDRMVDLIIRSRLMYSCRDGAITLDAQGDIVVPNMATDLIDIVLADISRIQSFAVRIGLHLRFSSTTEKWFATAKSLLKCRRALAFDNIEAVVVEMLHLGYLGRFRKSDFDNRPSHEEFDVIEKFLFEHMAEKTIRKAFTYLLSLTNISADEYHNTHIESLKVVSVVPQSMNKPTAYYTELMTLAKALRQAVSAAVTGDLRRLCHNEDIVVELMKKPYFPMSDIESTSQSLFNLLKSSVAGSKRFHVKLQNRKARGQGSDGHSKAVDNPYVKDLKKKLTAPGSKKKSLSSLLFGEVSEVIPEESLSVRDGSADWNADSAVSADGGIETYDPFCSPDDIDNDVSDFVLKRMRRSVEVPGVVIVQNCELSDLSFAILDEITASNRVAATAKTLASIFERIAIVVFKFKEPKQSATHSQSASDATVEVTMNSEDQRRAALRSKISKKPESLSQLHAALASPSVDVSLVEELEKAVSALTMSFKVAEPVWAVAALLTLKCLENERSNSDKTHSASDPRMLNTVPVSKCLAEFCLTLCPQTSSVVHVFRRQNISQKGSVKSPDLMSLSTFLSKSLLLYKATSSQIPAAQQSTQTQETLGSSLDTFLTSIISAAKKCSIEKPASSNPEQGDTSPGSVVGISTRAMSLCNQLGRIIKQF